jgi:hypothetical protein
MYPSKVVSREINHSVNCMYYRRLFGAKWKISGGGDLHILRNRLPQKFSIWHQKGVDSTYNLPNDLFLVKQLYLGTYVFEIQLIEF